MASSSSSPTPTLWDVFLSFRGTDTRNGFTSHLYNSLDRTGIRTFIDEPELRAGDVISLELHNAIKQSKIYIVVLSENYASSVWCLDELAEILERWKSLGRLVVPIFYKIEPSVVRYQLWKFGEAFGKHETRVDRKIVKKWRNALQEVANFSGYHVRKSHLRSEAGIINEVVDRVLSEINPGTLQVARYPVGIEFHVEKMESLLHSGSSDSNGVHWIGIHGMGGVGKTTLAKAFYNKMFRRFDGSCFLADIKDICVAPRGAVSLQQQLIDRVLKRKNTTTINNVDEGINFIRERICSLKVLVVLDDLDNTKQVDYLVGKFLVGSVIILTTRNEDLLDARKVKARYEVDALGVDESRQLFMKHAFGDTTIKEEFMGMSEEIVGHAGGLPLALTVFGSILFEEAEKGWRWFINRLKRLPIDDVEKNLMISFEALKLVDPELQDVFLDIACLFVGRPKDKAVEILETCYESIDHYISVLKKRSLITINENNRLWMHDLLQGMGRNIAGNSRLMAYEDIRKMLERDKGTEAIVGMLNLEDWGKGPYSCDAETFDRMPNLRILRLSNVRMRGSFGKPFKDLTWLSWYKCPSFPSNFCADKLVFLELRLNKICRFAENALVLGKLKFLDMSGSEQLSKTPDFNGLKCLETLNLSKCSRLVEVDVSIGNLERLATLDLSFCRSLTSLPESIYKLRALKTLNLTRCLKLEALPMELGNIESLTELDAKGTHILNLPNSIGRLSRLVRLQLSLCMNLTTLPDIICKLRSLEILNIHYFEGPEELASGNSTQLSNQQLPSTLKQLKAYNCKSLLKLPDLSNLQQLVEMDLFGCSNLREVEGLEKFTSLEKLHLRGCTSMKRLPDLSDLQKLKSLTLQGCSMFTEIEGLEDVLSLTIIDLSDCISLKRLPNLSNHQLKYLTLKGCSILTEIEGLEDVLSLTIIDLSYCTSLKRLPNLSNHQQLQYLKLKGCSILTENQGLEEVISLITLDLSGCLSLKSLPDLSKLQKIRDLHLRNCRSLREMEGFGKLISIKEFHLEGCTLLERLPDLSGLQNLKSLRLKGSSSLREMEGLDKLISIEVLYLQGCTLMERLPDLSDLQKLKYLMLKGCSHLTGIEGLEDVLSLTKIDLNGCISLKRFPKLSNLQKLKTLNLTDCSSLTEIQGLGEAVDITTFNCGGCKAMERLPNLSKLQQLKILQLSNCISLIEIQGLDEVISLTKLDLRGCISLCSLPDLSKLQNLQYLWLTNCSTLTEIESVERLISIRELHLGGCRLIKRLPNLSNMKKLKSLHVTGCSSLTEIQGLEKLNSITELDFRGCNMKRVPYVSMPPISIISLSAAGAAASSSGLPDGAVPKEAKDKSKDWKLTEVTEPSLCLSTRVTRLIYTDSGNAILALASNGIHLLSRWQGNDRNSYGMDTASVSPQLWQRSGSFLMTNEVTDEDSEDALSCFALSNNGRLLISELGRRTSIFDMITFKRVNIFRYFEPAATFLAFHPQDNNIIAIGLVGSSILIYNVHTRKYITELKGHLKRITGLAFSDVLNVLVSSGADAQLCVWSSNGWEKQNARYLQVPAGRIQAASSDTLVQFHLDQIHFLVVHETQLAIYETEKLECLKQWVPLESAAPITHATFSCDSQLIYACFLDASLCVFNATDFGLQCRIIPVVYLPPSVSTSRVHPLVIAAHPKEPNQFAVGLSEGGVRVFEPFESEGVLPSLENDSAYSVPTTTADEASDSDQVLADV